MSAPLLPAPLPELAREPFAFHPPIAGTANNEWVLRRSGWTELIVVNPITSEEITVPRRYVSAIAGRQNGLNIVSLSEPLEFRAGRVLPVRRRVLSMPGPGSRRPSLLKRQRSRPAPVVAIRIEPDRESRVRRALRGSVAIGFVACLALVFLVRDAHLGTRLGLSTGFSRDLPLSAEDDYDSVISKLGNPSEDRWIQDPAGGGRWRLWYPRRRMSVILSGETRETARYSATLGRDGSIIHSADTSGLHQMLLTPGWR